MGAGVDARRKLCNETLADRYSYGFREGRRCADALEQCFTVLFPLISTIEFRLNRRHEKDSVGVLRAAIGGLALAGRLCLRTGQARKPNGAG